MHQMWRNEGIHEAVESVENILSELRDERQMSLLSGRPWSRKPAQGVAERLVVCEDEKLVAFSSIRRKWWMAE